MMTVCTDRRVGPHNRCDHGTPVADGWKPCKADSACPVRVPDMARFRLAGIPKELNALRMATLVADKGYCVHHARDAIRNGEY